MGREWGWPVTLCTWGNTVFATKQEEWLRVLSPHRLCGERGSYENTWGQSAMGPWGFQEQVLAALERSLGVVQGSVAVPGRTALEWKRGWRHKAYLRTRGLREPAGTKGVGASLGECIWLMWPEPHVGVTGRKTKQRCTASRHTSPKTPPHKTL